MSRGSVRALLLGGPMYEPLYRRFIPAFEQATGRRVDVLACLPHPALNAEAKRLLAAGAPIDLLSTHTKYAPSQSAWLTPLELSRDEHDELTPAVRALSMLGTHLVQVPRFLDLRLLYHRRSAFADPVVAEGCARWLRRPLAVPDTWSDLRDMATVLTRPGRAGFLFPGRDSGLFGTFYELLVSAGGALFDVDAKGAVAPAFASPAGVWAADFLADLHQRRQITPAALPGWHYDEISAAFRRGESAMVCDWPGSHHLYANAETCVEADDVEIAPLPRGFTGRRAAYGGAHSFAVPTTAGDREGGLALLRWLTSPEARLFEARQGAVPVTRGVLATIRGEAERDPRQARRWQYLGELMETALIIPPRFARYPACEDVLWRALADAMTGNASPAEAIAGAAGAVAEITRDERVA